MAKNQRYSHADHITAPLPYDRAPGEAVLIGSIAGVALNGGKKGEKATIWLDGSWDIAIAGGVTPGQAINISDKGTLTTGAGSPWGVAVGSGAASGTGEVIPFGLVAPAAPAGE